MMVRRLPAGAVWQVIAIGRANLELTAIGLALGGNAAPAWRTRCTCARANSLPATCPLWPGPPSSPATSTAG